jgi:hypothetical protein
MVRLYLDLETYRPRKEGSFIEERIISVGLLIDETPQSLLDFSLMKSIPHKLLYLNMTTKNAYLFEKQEIVKKYSLKKEEGKESLTFEEV